MNNGSILSSQTTPIGGDLRIAASSDVLRLFTTCRIDPSAFISLAQAVGVNPGNAGALMQLK